MVFAHPQYDGQKMDTSGHFLKPQILFLVKLFLRFCEVQCPWHAALHVDPGSK